MLDMMANASVHQRRPHDCTGRRLVQRKLGIAFD
jgi:hypothetical protein